MASNSWTTRSWTFREACHITTHDADCRHGTENRHSSLGAHPRGRVLGFGGGESDLIIAAFCYGDVPLGRRVLRERRNRYPRGRDGQRDHGSRGDCILAAWQGAMHLLRPYAGEYGCASEGCFTGHADRAGDRRTGQPSSPGQARQNEVPGRLSCSRRLGDAAATEESAAMPENPLGANPKSWVCFL